MVIWAVALMVAESSLNQSTNQLLHSHVVVVKVAVKAVRQFFVRCSRMWRAVTFIARGKRRVSALVTECAREIPVFCRRLVHLFSNSLVAWGAEAPGAGFIACYLKWAVGRMALDAVWCHLILFVRFVAFGAVRDLFVNRVAEDAGEIWMFTGRTFKFILLFIVASQAGLWFRINVRCFYFFALECAWRSGG